MRLISCLKKFNCITRVVLIAAIYVGALALLFYAPQLTSGGLKLMPGVATGLDVDSAEIERTRQELLSRIERRTPTGPFLVINTVSNTFQLYNKRELVREGICSTGSYTKLVKNESEYWLFRTPKGIFRIKGKLTDPLWRKPDWYFVGAGLPVPPPTHESRFEYGVLGEYALNLGGGYLIHGTLYQRFLGLPVTHGCIRLGDDDLEVVFDTMPVGSRVYIF